MIPAIILFGVLLAPPLFLAAWREKRFEETVAVTTGSMILFMFLFGLAGGLKISVYVILGITPVLLGSSVYTAVRKKQVRRTLSVFFTPGFLAFCLVCVFLLYAHYGRLLHGWDEFTHWGDVVKAMCGADALSTNPALHSLFPNYAPGIALFQYLFEKIAMILPGGIFTDWRLYFSYHLLAFIFLLPFFNVRRWKFFLPAFTVIVFIAISPSFLLQDSVYLTTIYADGFVGLLAGAGLAMLFLKKRTGTVRAYLWVLCAVLVLAKDIGLLFAAAIGIVFIILEIRENKDRKQGIIRTVVTAAAIAVPKILWEISVRLSGLQTKFRAPIDLVVLFRILTGQEGTWRAGVPAACFGRMLNGTLGLEGTVRVTATWPVLAAILGMLLLAGWILWRKLDPEGKRRYRTAAWMMIAVLAVYCLGMPLLYIFEFGETSAGRLASFDRYMAIVFICFLVLDFLVLGGIPGEKPKRWAAAIVAVLLLGLFTVNTVTVEGILNRESLAADNDEQGKYDAVADAMTDLGGGEEKHVWIIAQENTGVDYWPIRYRIRPCNAELNVGWSIAANTEHLYPGDHNTIQIPTEEWKEKLKDYDYVLIWRANDSFREDYGELFERPEEIGDQSIFAVDHARDLLVKVY